MIIPLGSMSIGGAVPGVGANIALGLAGISSTLPELQGRLAAMVALPSVPDLTFAAQKALVQDMLANLTASIALLTAFPPLPPPPSIAAALAADIASLTAQIADLVSKASVLVGFESLLGTGAVDAYAFDGPLGSLGSELGSAVGSSSSHANALALVAHDSATWSAMSNVFKVSL